MAPSKATSSWDEEDSESTPPSSPPVIARRSKFEDEEEDGDVLDDWENEEDSEVEREKAKKEAEAKAKAEAAKKADHKTKAQRIEDKRQENLRKKMEQELDADSSDESESDRRAKAIANEKLADLKITEDLFGGAGGVSDKRAVKPVTVIDEKDPGNAIDLSSLSLFKPNTATGFLKLRETLVPLLTANSKKPQYPLFMAEFAKQLCKELNSEQIKKVAAGLNTMANEKMKEEKAAEKGGKKSKAQKTKTSLNASRSLAMQPDTELYDDGGLDDGDFM